ncbi:RTKN protein, partial [Alopecoenas beccarii]|nr:RTKN protein [Alopecoenas beccarii]
MFCRNQRSRVTVARGSALEMEIRRGRCRLSLLADTAQGVLLCPPCNPHCAPSHTGGFCCALTPDAVGAPHTAVVHPTPPSLHLPMVGVLGAGSRHGALGCPHRAVLGGSVPPHRPPAPPDLRIPLMWKDTEYFRNKGELHRCAVFCLLQLGAEIHDTPMVLVDRTLTDICFEGAFLFSEAGPDFELKVELYSAGLAGGPAQGSTPRKLATRLSTSLGRSSGKRVRAAMDGGPGSPPGNGGTAPLLLPTPNVPGPRFHLLAHAVLSLAEVQDGFRTHDLTIASNEESSFWLPLYGSMCCRLVAQPRCMAAPVTSGFLLLQQPGAEAPSGTRLFCVLRGTGLLCYRDPGHAEGGMEPALTIAVNKETRIRATEREGRGQPHGMAVTNRYGGEEVTHTLVAESQAEAQRWLEAFWQHFYDMSQWKQCCEELMRMEVPPPRRPPAVLPRQGSLYHEMAIDPADDIEAVTDILTRRAGGQAPGTPPWLSLFEEPPPCAPPS